MRKNWKRVALAAVALAGGAAVAGAQSPRQVVNEYLHEDGTYFVFMELDISPDPLIKLIELVAGPNFARSSEFDIPPEKMIEGLKFFFEETAISDIIAYGESFMPWDDAFETRRILVLPKERRGVWSILDDPPSRREGLEFMPADTEFLFNCDFRGDRIAALIIKIGSHFDPNFATRIGDVTTDTETGIVGFKVLQSISGEVSFALGFDRNMPIPFPAGGTGHIIGMPSFTGYIESVDPYLLHVIKSELRAADMAFKEEKIGDFEAVSLGLNPIPMMPTLYAWDGQRLIFTSKKADFEKLLSGQSVPMIKSNTDFCEDVSHVPAATNSLVWLSPYASELIMKPLQLGTAERGLHGELVTMLFNVPPFVYHHTCTENSITSQYVTTGESGFFFGSNFQSVGILSAIAIPSFLRAREISRRNACQENLSRIDGAKQQWALENNKPASAQPTWDVLVGPRNYIRSSPICPASGTYTINPIDEDPECSLMYQDPFPHTFPQSFHDHDHDHDHEH